MQETRFFDYAALPDETQEFLRDVAASFERPPTCSAEAIALGEQLESAKEKLPHGAFRRWCRTECSWSDRTISNLMAAARAAKSIPNGRSVHLPATILYALAARSTPPAVKSTLHADIGNGKRLAAKRLAELFGREREAKSADGKPPISTDAVAAIFDAGVDSLHLFAVDDGEQIVYHGRAAMAKVIRHEIRATPQELVEALAKPLELRTCTRCPPGTPPKPLSAFVRERRRKDGRAMVCTACYNAQRVEKRKNQTD